LSFAQFSRDLSADWCPSGDVSPVYTRVCGDYIIGGSRRLNTDCTRTVDVETVYERSPEAAAAAAARQTSMSVHRHVAFFTRRRPAAVKLFRCAVTNEIRSVAVKCVQRLLLGDGWTDQRRSYVTAPRWNVQLSPSTASTAAAAAAARLVGRFHAHVPLSS